MKSLQRKVIPMTDFEKIWRGSGLGAALFFIVAYILYGMQPKVGAATDKLVSYYDGDSTRILIATVIVGFGILNLTWFAAALASVLRDAGKGGWGTAATAASAALAAVYFVLVTLRAGLAYTIAGSSNADVTAGLHDLTWVLTSLFWFPTAMLIMAGSFGLHRAGLISNRAFGAGVTAMVLVLLATTTWAADGFWAVDGAYARFVPTLVMLAWISVVSAFLVRRLSGERAPAAVPVPAA
jgi:hypothetical protein